jgi:hypothetical protein
MKNTLYWILALIITLSAAVFQRMTGPTRPQRGSIDLGGEIVSFKLERSHTTDTDYTISLEALNADIQGYALYRLHKTSDPWERIAFNRTDSTLKLNLPKQPAAGKIDYRVFLALNGQESSLTGEKTMVIRFKDNVPVFILILHAVIMLLAMLFSTRAGIEALRAGKNPRKLVLWTVSLLFLGGLVLGPIVQKFAFGQFWTGFPFGYDLTDNKTLIAFLGWCAALFAGRKGKPARGWVLGASLLLFAVYLSPHSLLGSELKYESIRFP